VRRIREKDLNYYKNTRERFKLLQELREIEIEDLSIKALLGNGPKQFKIYELLFHFLKDTHLINRI